MPGTHSFLSTLALALVFFGSTASYAHPTPAKDGSAVGMKHPYREGHHYYDYDHDHDLIDLDDDVLGHGLLGVHLRDVASESLSKKEKKKIQKQKKKEEKEAKKNKKNKKKNTKKPTDEIVTIEEAPKGEEVVEIAVDVDDAHATADAASPVAPATAASATAEEVLIVTRSEQVASKSKKPSKDSKTKSKDKQKDKKKDKSSKDSGKKSGKDKTSKTDKSKSSPADDDDSGSGGHDDDDDDSKTLMDHATDIVEGVGSVARLATAGAELFGV